MQNNGVAHGNIVDNDDVIIIEDNTAHNNPQEPEILEISDDEVEVLALVKPKRNPQSIQQVSGGVCPKFAVSAAQRSQVRVDLTQSDNVPGVGRMGMEVEETVDDEEDSDVEETNIDTSSTESMLNFIMGTPNEPSTSAAGTAPTTFRTPVGFHQIKKRLTGNPGSSNEPSTSSGSSAPVENPQIKKKLTVHPIAPTPAKRRCLRSTETVQNERARPRSSQENQQCSAGPSSSSAPLKPITADAPSTSESITAPIAQSSSRRSTRTVLVPKESENKENVPKTLEPGPSSASEASSSKPALQRQCPEAETDAGTASTTFRTPIGVQQMKKRLTGNPGISNEPSTSSGSSAPVENPQIKTKLTVHPIAPTPAKRICVRSIETVQNERALPRTSQGNQQNSAGPSTSSASFEAIQVDAPSTSGAGPAPLAQHLPRRSTRTVVAPKESENKENVPETLEPGPSSMQKPGPSPASENLPFNPAPQRQSPKIKKDEKPIEVGSAPKPIAIGAAILGEENKNKIFYFPRTPAVPTGLRRTPFNGELPKDIRRKCEYSKIMRKLKIQKDVNFLKSIPEGKMIKSVLGNEEEKPAKATYPGDPSKNDPKGVATLEKFLGDTPDQAYMNLKDKEEKVWSAEKLEEHLEGDEGRKEAFYRFKFLSS
ncbi:hypothetical protein CAEBREN_22488 [Caenorhabditis brenneri]|uniref:Uncharacterized protein n=1 Tax=Caenorhabditis brenneri TaxID=135651 RepID=G0MQY6_CAEBE|nr:hypothetical protein CAEBREN_22488 [Caenorhabditis brenneri]